MLRARFSAHHDPKTPDFGQAEACPTASTNLTLKQGRRLRRGPLIPQAFRARPELQRLVPLPLLARRALPRLTPPAFPVRLPPLALPVAGLPEIPEVLAPRQLPPLPIPLAGQRRATPPAPIPEGAARAPLRTRSSRCTCGIFRTGGCRMRLWCSVRRYAWILRRKYCRKMA